jgi:DNA-binding LytR/AlgR family response regulator
MINCIAIDDEPMALEVIKSLCARISFINLTHTFTQVSAAQKHLRKFPVDLIFLDIQMPDMNGVDLYKSIEQKAMVIFTTAYSVYAVEGFNVNAIDYLLKPIEFDRFSTACDKAKEYAEYLKPRESTPQANLFVRSEYALVKILYKEIFYLETMDDYIKIHLKEGRTVLTLMSMKKMLEKLPSKDFIRVHRSYIIPFSRIESVSSKSISLGSIEIPIGASYKTDFLEAHSSGSS